MFYIKNKSVIQFKDEHGETWFLQAVLPHEKVTYAGPKLLAHAYFQMTDEQCMEMAKEYVKLGPHPNSEFRTFDDLFVKDNERLEVENKKLKKEIDDLKENLNLSRILTSQTERTLHERVLKQLSEMTAEQIFELSVKAGIHNSDGSLTEPYQDSICEESGHRRSCLYYRETCSCDYYERVSKLIED